MVGVVVGVRDGVGEAVGVCVAVGEAVGVALGVSVGTAVGTAGGRSVFAGDGSKVAATGGSTAAVGTLAIEASVGTGLGVTGVQLPLTTAISTPARLVTPMSTRMRSGRFLIIASWL